MKTFALTMWYQKLPAREQRILRIGAIVVGVILLLWVLLPLQRNLMQARDHLRQQQTDLDWMRQNGPTLAAAGPGKLAVATDHESVVVLIDRSAQEAGLGKALTGSTPAGSGAMLVQLENADFNLLLGWLDRLATQHGLRVDNATITSAGGAGVVNASVQLRPGT